MRKQLAVERTAILAAAARPAVRGERRNRQRLGFCLVEIGLRIACDRPVPSQA
ncbi:MAG: hypothetical protein ACXWZT_11260 [Gaiellaceae bacterium]